MKEYDFTTACDIHKTTMFVDNTGSAFDTEEDATCKYMGWIFPVAKITFPGKYEIEARTFEAERLWKQIQRDEQDEQRIIDALREDLLI